ncbi:oxygen-independent coproporphyrinogen III oxidase [Pontivivens insulae]|uniref:Coproporphyrinogen-III oxidase n=1 Tax=Pontivivens insulae TaxID=1639689 RepID=A0A2R8AFG5_9RHOB|nr:oxygen-independent coproporphyrinogen III oxidase [Pontivivens insulae]RED12225.1 anaerobic coproporphyrinogen III oxidase [Pontivivens insulae]SPF30981.1 Oxygen-independent coproporphyrinogen III oxidase [Pontivivens insulae]
MVDAKALLTKFSHPVPRYTSYPTAPQFRPGTAQRDMEHTLGNVGSQPVSLYVHIPYCNRLCWFCGCNTKHTLRYAPVRAYVDTLLLEIEQVAGKMQHKADLARIHFGGGSPSILQPEDVLRIGEALEHAFSIRYDAEISVELDPAAIPSGTLGAYRSIGMNRASLGVQDFAPKVQQAINRPQSYEDTADVIQQLRSLGVRSLNLDALYGLPFQTVETVQSTMDQVVSLAPNRIALFGYAHVPWMKPHQKMIPQAALPDALTRYEQSKAASDRLIGAGYVPVGIDHFAKWDEELALAASTDQLHRNFQGYTTDPCETLIGLGASAISRFPTCFVQNEPATANWRARVEAGAMAAAKSCQLDDDDHLRGWAIERLMCDFAIPMLDLSERFGSTGADLAEELAELAAREQDGLCEISDGRFIIPDDARAFTRIVAARLDAYLDQGPARYSQAV